jgi:phthalate 4,5-dioxygenase oxygenase subunit
MRERRADWSYSGIPWGKPHQDMAVTESMGPVYDRQGEHLGFHDEMVVRLRQRLLADLRRFMATGQTLAEDPTIPWPQVRGGTALVSTDTPWSAVEYAAEVEARPGRR